MTTRSPWIALAFALASGCTLEAGHGFGTIESASFAAALRPGEARDLGDHTVLTDLAFRVHVVSAVLSVDRIELQTLQGGGGGGAFDPAHPPEGYTLCHGGHCHAVDGRVVDYVDVMAELAGGGSASFATVATIAVGADVDLLEGATSELASIEPRELASGSVSRAAVLATALHIEATATGGRADAELDGEVPIEVTLPIGTAITAGADRRLDRDHERQIDLGVALVVDGTLFDGLDLVALQGSSDSIRIDSIEEPAGLAIVRSVASSELTVSFSH